MQRLVAWFVVMVAAGSVVLGGPPAAEAETVPTPGAWRPAEALARLLVPPADAVQPIDEAHLTRTRTWRERIAQTDAGADALRRIELADAGGRRVWLFDGDALVVFRVDTGDDGTVEQSQYFGPEGLFAVVHRLDGGRRTQLIFWPPGKPRIVEIRDDHAPMRGVWWRSEDNPFPAPDAPDSPAAPATPGAPAAPSASDAPAAPRAPAAPAHPGEPAEPADPADPTQPTRPAEPGR